MFSLIKQVFIALLSFSSSLTRDQTKCLFLNDEPCMVRPTLIDLNPFEFRFYPFMISLHKCSGSCNNVLSSKICLPKETKDVNVKTFNMITNKNKAKAMTKHCSCNCKCKFKLQHVIQNKNGKIKHVNVNVKMIIHAKKYYSWNPSTCTCENSKYC